MIRSLYSGVSGLTTHQTRMDVIGNNIANVNTYGFKASRTTFRDIYYQTSINPTAGGPAFAGNNAAQVGYGVQLGSIDKDMSQSNGQSTGKVFDMMLDGDGMFMTATYSSLNLASDASASTVRFTRMGMFGIDSYGNLASSNNVFLVGSRNSLAGLHNNGDISANYLDRVEIKDRDGDGIISSSDVTYRNTINMNELIQSSYNVFTDEYGYMYGYDWKALIKSSEGVLGNPAATPPTETTLPGEPLMKYDLTLYGGTAEQLLQEYQAYENEDEGIEFLKQFIDVHDTLENLNGIISGEIDPPEMALPAGMTAIAGLAGVFGLDTTAGGGGGGAAGANSPANAIQVILSARYYVDKYGNELDCNETDLGTGNETVNGGGDTKLSDYLESYSYLRASTSAQDLIDRKASVDHFGGITGELTYKDVDSVNVGTDGVITVNYNGKMRALARIEIAVFDNYDGLTEDGQTTFKDSPASGICGIKKPSELAYTNVKSGYLEASNVNLAQEFSDMIVTQRGFQANARIITTSDSMLEELVNLKR
ncbi:MAG: flagellar hook-basal body complex protein [Oscillospiraceae bacterium]|nr:flagellar hook-basal body complex protein [Oscillospiraceae bacterium]